jgi:hypothetical protein
MPPLPATARGQGGEGGNAGVSAAAAEACAQGLAFVHEVARDHLDEVYREGWLQRNEINRELSVLASRLGA